MKHKSYPKLSNSAAWTAPQLGFASLVKLRILGGKGRNDWFSEAGSIISLVYPRLSSSASFLCIGAALRCCEIIGKYESSWAAAVATVGEQRQTQQHEHLQQQQHTDNTHGPLMPGSCFESGLKR